MTLEETEDALWEDIEDAEYDCLLILADLLQDTREEYANALRLIYERGFRPYFYFDSPDWWSGSGPVHSWKRADKSRPNVSAYPWHLPIRYYDRITRCDAPEWFFASRRLAFENLAKAIVEDEQQQSK